MTEEQQKMDSIAKLLAAAMAKIVVAEIIKENPEIFKLQKGERE